MLSSEAREQGGRYLRRVGEGLVVELRELRDHLQGVLVGDHELDVLGPQMVRNPAGIGRLVVGRVLEGDREAADLVPSVRLHQGDDDRGVDSSGQKRPERHIGMHPYTNRLGQDLIELVHGLGTQNRTRAARRTPPPPTEPSTSREGASHRESCPRRG